MSLRRLLAILACSFCILPLHAEERLTVAYPGPFNVSYLPLDLLQKIGADKAEGIQVVARHTSGGGTAIQHMLTRNTDFAVAGLPAAMSAKANGNDIVVISAVDDLPVFVLTVRSDLKGQIKRPRDLAGKVVGVTSSSLAIKTISQQLAELLLKNDGLSPGQVRIVAAGQSWEEQSAVIRSKSADALLGFEPFASRLRDSGLVFFLFNLGNPVDAASVPGAGLLQASLQTRSDVLRETPYKAEKMVAALRRTLQWMATHTPEQIVDILQIEDAETRSSLLKSLRQYPRLYSRDGKFSEHQLEETRLFYQAADGAVKPVAIESLIDARWAGRKP